MKSLTKKLLSMALAVMMVFSIIPMGIVNASAAGAKVSGQRVKSYVESLVGKSYTRNGCLAFVADVFRDLGGTRSSACCAKKYASSNITSTSSTDIPIGADVYFGNKNINCGTCKQNCGHIGIYVGGGYMVHASGGVIRKDKINGSYSNGRRADQPR